MQLIRKMIPKLEKSFPLGRAHTESTRHGSTRSPPPPSAPFNHRSVSRAQGYPCYPAHWVDAFRATFLSIHVVWTRCALGLSLQSLSRQIHWYITSKNLYKNEVQLFVWRSWNRQTDGIDFGMYSQRPFEWYMTRLPKLKISWRRGKPSLHYGANGILNYYWLKII